LNTIHNIDDVCPRFTEDPIAIYERISYSNLLSVILQKINNKIAYKKFKSLNAFGKMLFFRFAC